MKGNIKSYFLKLPIFNRTRQILIRFLDTDIAAIIFSNVLYDFSREFSK